MRVRDVEPAEWVAAGDVCVSAYVADGLLPMNDRYVEELRDTAARVRAASVLVAVDQADTVLGVVTFCRPGSPYAELARPGEAEFRMLAVSPAARGLGAGTALVNACLDRARAAGDTAVVLSTLDLTANAQRLYLQLGFVPTPDRDWEPRPGLWLRAYRRDITGSV